jgi:hypothetical protein
MGCARCCRCSIISSRRSWATSGERGLLDDVLVMAMGEFGRTPRIGTQESTDGRDHWPYVMSMALAGGGLRHGQVIGASSRDGGEIASRPVTPGDFGGDDSITSWGAIECDTTRITKAAGLHSGEGATDQRIDLRSNGSGRSPGRFERAAVLGAEEKREDEKRRRRSPFPFFGPAVPAGACTLRPAKQRPTLPAEI